MGDFNRRTVLAAATLAATGGVALAQAPARQKGPLVWLDMDQQELDDAYDQSKYAANLAQIVKRYATNSEAVRTRLGAPRRYAYMAGRGAWVLPRISRTRPSFSSRPVRITWCSTSSMLSRRTAALCRWPSRCAERWRGYIATPRALVATRTAYTSPATPQCASCRRSLRH